MKKINEELEQVAGGYYNTWKDYEAIKKLEKNGYGTFYNDGLRYCTKGVQDAFIKIGKELGMNISSKRDELWNIINEGFAAKK